MTTQYLYDSLIGDGIGLDSSDGVSAVLLGDGNAEDTIGISITEALTKLALPIGSGGLNITFGPDPSNNQIIYGGSASVMIAPDELTMQVSISDAMGRPVMNALLHGPEATGSAQVGGLIDWSYTLHEQVIAVNGANFGDMQAVFSIDSDEEIVKSFSDDLGQQRGSIDQLGNISKRINGPKGEPRFVYDARGNQMEYKYDILGRQIEVVDALGKSSTTEYDAAGRVEKQFDFKGNFTKTQYDGLGRVWKTTDRVSKTTTRAYDSAGRLEKLTDAEGKITTYDYDPLGQRTLVTTPDNMATLMKYDAAGRVIYSEQPSGKNQTVYYALSGVREKIEYRDQVDPSIAPVGKDQFTYDAFLRPTGGTSFDSVITVRGYTNRGQLLSEQMTYDNQTYTTSYVYDDRGRLEEIAYPSGRKATYTYDDRNLPEFIYWHANRFQNELQNRSYDENGMLAGVVRPSGVVAETRSYDTRNLLDQIANPGVLTADYEYDANGNKLKETFSDAGTATSAIAAKSFTTVSGTDEGYDAEDRFMRFTQTGNNVSMSRNGIGSISDFTLNGNTSTRSYSDVHELDDFDDSNNGSEQGFDADGNLISSIASGLSLTWDETQRMKSATVNTPSGFEGDVSYLYCIDGRRVVKTVSPTAGAATTTVYVHAGPNCIAEYAAGQASGSPDVQFVYSGGIDSLALIDDGTSELSVLRNQQWSVTALVDNSNGSVAERYSYDHFGKRTIHAADGTLKTASSYKNPYGYTSRRHEVETGLMYFRARYYDPSTGEFISRDPLEYVDGMSLYRGYFVPGAMDPFGLQTELTVILYPKPVRPTGRKGDEGFWKVREAWGGKSVYSTTRDGAEEDIFQAVKNHKAANPDHWVWPVTNPSYAHGSLQAIPCSNECIKTLQILGHGTQGGAVIGSVHNIYRHGFSSHPEAGQVNVLNAREVAKKGAAPIYEEVIQSKERAEARDEYLLRIGKDGKNKNFDIFKNVNFCPECDITFRGCSVGQGPRGKKFLQEVANATGCSVHAFSGTSRIPVKKDGLSVSAADGSGPDVHVKPKPTTTPSP